MSLTISCEITPKQEMPATYWWPLLFEAMRRLDFGFARPYPPVEQLGRYYLLTPSDSDMKEGQSFRELWNDIYSDKGRVYAQFWSQREPGFEAMCGVSTGQTTGKVEISFDLLSLHAGDAPEDTKERRLHRWIDGIRILSDLCAPCIAEMYHEHAGVAVRFGALGISLVLEYFADGPDSGQPYEGEIIEETLPNGLVLSFLKDIDFPHAGPVTITLSGTTS